VERASLEEDEHTSDESREMATDIMATSTTKLAHSIILTRFIRFALASLKMRTISLRSAQIRLRKNVTEANTKLFDDLKVRYQKR